MMYRSAALLVASLVALAGLVAATPTSDAPRSATHTVEITYAEGRGDLRRAIVRIRPETRTRPAWRGEIVQIAFYTGRQSGWQVFRAGAARDGVYQIEAQLPPFAAIRAFGVRTNPGDSHVWQSPSTYGDDDDEDTGDDKEDPGTGDGDDGGGDDDDDGDDGGGCTNMCMEIINPWTCECSDPDPWEGERPGQQQVSFKI